MKKIIIAVLILSTSTLFKIQAQPILIPEWYLKYIFNSMDEVEGSAIIGAPLLTKAEISKNFLISKLNDVNIPYKIRAISLLGDTRDASVLKIIEKYIDNDNDIIAMTAITAISKIGDSLSVTILENKLKRSVDDIDIAIFIAKKLEMNCSATSIPLLEYLIQKMQQNSMVEEVVIKKIKNTIETINKLEKDKRDKKKLIINRLIDDEYFDWSIFQMLKLNDKNILPEVRNIQNRFKDETIGSFGISNVRYNNLLMVRLMLGDDQLTPVEEAYVAKNPQIWPLEKRYDLIRQEIEFLEKNGYGKD